MHIPGRQRSALLDTCVGLVSLQNLCEREREREGSRLSGDLEVAGPEEPKPKVDEWC